MLRDFNALHARIDTFAYIDSRNVGSLARTRFCLACGTIKTKYSWPTHQHARGRVGLQNRCSKRGIYYNRSPNEHKVCATRENEFTTETLQKLVKRVRLSGHSSELTYRNNAKSVGVCQLA